MATEAGQDRGHAKRPGPGQHLGGEPLGVSEVRDRQRPSKCLEVSHAVPREEGRAAEEGPDLKMKSFYFHF